uniref:SNF2 super family n=1 Tax=Dunaliella tertiolecta TaxID=3047 RepID=A0A6S8IFU9_DUNTE
MGLGKTVQTLGFFSHLKSKGIHGPFMVVGPLSTLSNWIAETQRFLPCLKPLLYHGSKQERANLRAQHLEKHRVGTKVPEDFPLIVTSYEILIADSKFLGKMRFKYVVVDEGHRLKNFDCRLVRELRTIPMENRLLLTGTPLQNNLAELWSLLNFLMPDIFNSMSDFESWFEFSSAVGQQGASQEIVMLEQRNKVISKLHGILRPFVLRRLKADVQISLPQKKEIILYSKMTDTQLQLNKQMMDRTLMAEMEQLAKQNGGSLGNVGKLNNMLMQMRKNCNHPDLITSAFSNDVLFPPPEVLLGQCGKLQLLDRLLKELQARKHKVLIFSQMTKMLDVIESFLDQQGHRACRIDGSVPWQERQENISSFNNDENTWIFLLSTRAGGLGINLTAADTVIIYDSDWNPHQDMQAMDRCHRIGQQRPVLVFRLVTAHSVEGKMLKRAGDKMALERIVIKKGAFQDLCSGGKGKEEAETEENTALSLTELQEMLQGTYKMNDVPQSGEVSCEVLHQLLDRQHLADKTPQPYPNMGVGYEVVQSHNTSGMLQDISGNPEMAV